MSDESHSISQMFVSFGAILTYLPECSETYNNWVRNADPDKTALDGAIIHFLRACQSNGSEDKELHERDIKAFSESWNKVSDDTVKFFKANPWVRVAALSLVTASFWVAARTFLASTLASMVIFQNSESVAKGLQPQYERKNEKWLGIAAIATGAALLIWNRPNSSVNKIVFAVVKTVVAVATGVLAGLWLTDREALGDGSMHEHLSGDGEEKSPSVADAVRQQAGEHFNEGRRRVQRLVEDVGGALPQQFADPLRQTGDSSEHAIVDLEEYVDHDGSSLPDTALNGGMLPK